MKKFVSLGTQTYFLFSLPPYTLVIPCSCMWYANVKLEFQMANHYIDITEITLLQNIANKV